jgi:hypothetical protein
MKPENQQSAKAKYSILPLAWQMQDGGALCRKTLAFFTVFRRKQPALTIVRHRDKMALH